MQISEEWRPIPGFVGYYSASSIGRIRSEDRVVRHYSGGPKRLRGAILSPHVSTFGYLQVTLSSQNKLYRFPVHRLVLMAFSGSDGAGLDCRHLDGDRKNNSIGNLAWGTRAENMADAVRHGRTNRGNKNPCAKLNKANVSDIRMRLLSGESQAALAKSHGVDQSTISDIKTRRTWAHVD